MIIYNSNYEFIGVSDSYVKRLNFPSFNALKYRADGDIANLFVEKKGFVYNFEYLSWIEFILQNIDKAQVIVKGGDGSHYKIDFSIEPYYFAENNEKGYLIQIKSLEDYEMDGFAIDETSFQNKDKNISYYVDEDEYHISDEESFSKTEDNFENESPTFAFADSDNQNTISEKSEPIKEINEFSFDNSFETDTDIEVKSHIIENSEKEISPKTDIPSPEEFLKSFEIEDTLKESDNSNLLQNDNLNSEKYNIDEVAKTLNINQEVLLNFVIDFIYNMNNIKPYIYKFIELNKMQDVQNNILLLKGFCLNLKIMNIYNSLDAISSKNYRESSELLEDINLVYNQINLLNKEINNGDAIPKFDNNQVIRSFISSVNISSLPDIIFQDIINNFLKIFDNSKEKLEASLNPDGIQNLKLLIKELDNISRPLNINDLNLSISNILQNINNNHIEYDKLVINWIELSEFVNKLK